MQHTFCVEKKIYITLFIIVLSLVISTIMLCNINMEPSYVIVSYHMFPNIF